MTSTDIPGAAGRIAGSETPGVRSTPAPVEHAGLVAGAARAALAPRLALAPRPPHAMPDVATRLARFRALDRAARPVPGPDRGLLGAPGMRHSPPRPDTAARLAEALGGTVERGPGGRIVRVTTRRRLPVAWQRLGALPYPVDVDRPLLCLDTETTGLGTAAGTVAFLVGIGRWEDDDFVVDQLLLPDHSDEGAFLAALRGAIPPDAWLVTYNGRGFDWPLLVTRFRLHRSSAPDHAGHLDLLAVARQLWRHRLGDARLSTVESAIVGVRRPDDLPGALVPARYLEFLRSGRAEPMRAVADHNRQDVVSLALLVAHLAGRLADPDVRAREHPGDVAALSRAFARRRRFAEALACSDAAIGSAPDARFRETLRAERARLLRMAGRRAESADAWHEIAVEGGPLAAVAWVQLAKHREHVTRDLAGALDATERAAALVQRHCVLGRDAPRLEHDLRRRRTRLRRRLARAGSGARE